MLAVDAQSCASFKRTKCRYFVIRFICYILFILFEFLFDSCFSFGSPKPWVQRVPLISSRSNSGGRSNFLASSIQFIRDYLYIKNVSIIFIFHLKLLRINTLTSNIHSENKLTCLTPKNHYNDDLSSSALAMTSLPLLPRNLLFL